MTDKRRSRTATVRASDNSMEVSIDRRLLLYALAAGATLACSVPSEAEIIFTPSSAVFQGPVRFSIDLDNDGSADFSFVLRQCRSFSGYQVVGCASAAGKHRFNDVAVNWQYQAAPLLAAATVGFRHRFRTSAPMGTAFRYIGYGGQVKDRLPGKPTS